jgi:hypothetical protein
MSFLGSIVGRELLDSLGNYQFFKDDAIVLLVVGKEHIIYAVCELLMIVTEVLSFSFNLFVFKSFVCRSHVSSYMQVSLWGETLCRILVSSQKFTMLQQKGKMQV